MAWLVGYVLNASIVVKEVHGIALKLFGIVSAVDKWGTAMRGRDERHGDGGCMLDCGAVWDEESD